jgi:hypothetical protein
MAEVIRQVSGETDASTVANAAYRINSLLDGDPSQDDTHPETEEPEVETPEKAEAEEPETEEPEKVAEGEDEPTPVTHFTELADHLGVEEDFLENLIVPTKVNGETREATIKDLVASFQKGESADVKLMELAEQRKHFDSELEKTKSQIQQEWGRVQTLSNELTNALMGEDVQELEALKVSDPDEYRMKMMERNMKLQRIEEARHQFQQEHAQKINEQYQNTVSQERKKLLYALPEWQDEKVASKENKEIRDFLISYGFNDWEIDGKIDNGVVTHPGIIDHRAVVLARKAMLYDQSRKDTAPKKAKLKSLPKVGSGRKQTREDVKVQQKTEMRGRVRKTGTLDDAALAIKAMMEK